MYSTIQEYVLFDRLNPFEEQIQTFLRTCLFLLYFYFIFALLLVVVVVVLRFKFNRNFWSLKNESLRVTAINLRNLAG